MPGRCQSLPLEPAPIDPTTAVSDATGRNQAHFPGAPSAPQAMSRPASWPGGEPTEAELAANAGLLEPSPAVSIAGLSQSPSDRLAQRFSPSQWSAAAHASAWRAAAPMQSLGPTDYDDAVQPVQYAAPVVSPPGFRPPNPAPVTQPYVPSQPPYGAPPPPNAPVGAVPSAGPVAAPSQPPGIPAPASTSVPFATAAPVAGPSALQTDFPFKLPSYSVDNATIVARINGEAVLAGELLDVVNERLAENDDRVPKEPESQEMLRQQLMRNMLPGLLDTKMIAMQARKKIPADNLPKVEGELGKEFDKEYLGKMVDQHRLDNKTELDQKLKKWGTSLARVRKSHMEGLLARKWMFMQLKLNEEITRDEMLEYYRAHLVDYEHDAKARWEQLTAKVTLEQPKPTAYAKLAQLGNQLLAGANFAELAKTHSDGATASDGGVHDWTTRGSLKSALIDQTLFTMPVGQLSPILEDAAGFHIVRVIEREDAGRQPFEEAQPTIRMALREQRFQAHRSKYVDKVRSESNIWTMYDDEAAANRLTQQPSGPVR